MSINEKLDEAWKNVVKPYIDKPDKALTDMCRKCEAWNGADHDYSECRNEQCFRNYLAYAYIKWSDGYR